MIVTVMIWFKNQEKEAKLEIVKYDIQQSELRVTLFCMKFMEGCTVKNTPYQKYGVTADLEADIIMHCKIIDLATCNITKSN
jgi:hypothetical protein